MTKEELKAYLSEAVDAMDSTDLEILFPASQQPDLYSVVEELTGLKGTVNKLSGASLKLNHEIHSLIEQVGSQQAQQAEFLSSLQAKEETAEAEEAETLDKDLKVLLEKLLEMDEVFQLANKSYGDLPQPTWFNLNQYKSKVAAWQQGFDITLNRWQQLLQATNLYKIGLVGEPFDPELHEAVAVKHQNDVTDNQIIETEQTGFLYKGKVLRLAKVVVNKVKIVQPTITEPALDEVTEKVVELIETVVQEPIKIKTEKTKPKPKRKKGRGGRRKKRKRNRK